MAEVSLALETARALWAKGLTLESVRWIQRAAENAESAGNDLRAVALARAAADLRAEVSVSSEPPGRITEAAALTPYDDFTESTIVDSPASTLARVALQSSVHIAELPVTPPQSSVIAAPLPSAAAAPAAPAAPARAGLVAPHQALRVYLVSGDATSRELSVRVLEEGESAPAGATEALLVALDPRARLL